MTRHISTIACVLAAVCVLGQPVPVHAKGWDHWWDYLDNLSGPGPFHGGPTISASFLCWHKQVSEVPGRSPSRRATVKQAAVDPFWDPCLYVDWRHLDARPASPFGYTSANLVDFGISLQVSPFFEFGAGVGFSRFQTYYDGVEKPFTVTSHTVTPLRIVVKPLKIFKRTWRDDPRFGALQFVVRDTIRFGRITGADFGAPGSTWESGTEYLRGRYSILLDLLQAVKPAIKLPNP
jgi:hypothetical protein